VTESTKKFFALIDGRPVAPQGKKLPQEAYSTLLDCQGLLATVKKDADEYRKKVAAECEELKKKAEIEGFAAGYNQWAQMVAALEKEIGRVKGELQTVVMTVAIKAAKKIVTTELTVNPQVTLDMVTNTLKTVAAHKKIVVYVSKQDYELIDKEKNKIKLVFEELESLTIRERDDLGVGDFIIETEGGIINARVKDRWRTLEAALESLGATVSGKEAP
jgi:type III secretion protein L